MSDPNTNPRPSTPDEDVDELPGESAASAAEGLSLEEQLAQLSDLEIDEAPEKKTP